MSHVSYNISEMSDKKPEQPNFKNAGNFGVVFDQRGEDKIETKDHLWRPAPIVGRDFIQQEVKVTQPMSQQLYEMRQGLYNNQPGMVVRGEAMVEGTNHQGQPTLAASSLPQFGVDHQPANPQGKTIYAQ